MATAGGKRRRGARKRRPRASAQRRETLSGARFDRTADKLRALAPARPFEQRDKVASMLRTRIPKKVPSIDFPSTGD